MTGRLCALCIVSCSRSFFYCAPKQWNSLPSVIRHIQSSHAFKTGLKTHLLQYNQYYTAGDFKFCLLPFAPLIPIPHPLPTLCYIPPVHVCVCTGVLCEVYNIVFILFFLRFYVDIFVDLLKRNVFTLVSEILCYRNGRYC